MITNNIVHLSILLGKGDPKIALKHIAEKDNVLFRDRLIETVLCLQVSADFSRDSLVVHERVAWYLVHGDECGSGDEPDRYHPGDQSFDRVIEHG